MPTTREDWADAQTLTTFYVPKDGKLLVDLSPEGNAPPAPPSEAALARIMKTSPLRASYDGTRLARFALVVDRDVTYGALKSALAPLLAVEKEFALTVAPAAERRVDRSKLGELGSFLGPETKEAALRFYTLGGSLADTQADSARAPSGAHAITIVTDGPTATIFSRRLPGGLIKISMTADAAAVAERRAAFDHLVEDHEIAELGIAPKDDDTLQAIWQLADEARSMTRSSPRIVLSSDRRSAEERDSADSDQGFGGGIGLIRHGQNQGDIPIGALRPMPSTSSMRAGALQVNGRLPPEVISRIVRQNFGRFRLCYENGLRTNPNLQGRVAVKFVIDRTGSVTTATDGGSDLPDSSVVACVVRGFSNLSFPQPEGGIVTVVYPIVFSAAAK